MLQLRNFIANSLNPFVAFHSLDCSFVNCSFVDCSFVVSYTNHMALAAEGHYSIAIVNIDHLHRKDYSTESVAADCSCINRPDSIDL